MNEKNIESLKLQMMSLGLQPDIEYELRANICLQPDHFQVSCRQIKDADTMNSLFYFERNETDYCCQYYETCLRKKISLPAILLNEVNVNELHERMGDVNRDIGFSYNSMNKIQKEKATTWEREETIDGIVTDLKKLSITTEGLRLADRLKVKFWLDTPFASFVSNINVLRNQYEVSQRFYFFDGEEQITIDEAYRFLSHRWREKQLNAKKKETENNEGSDNGGSPVSMQKVNKLLGKKRSKGKQHKV